MSLPASNSPVLPEQFGPYRIVRPLGQGGMGAVYLARDSRLDRDVALKVCSFADNPQSLGRFRREAKLAAGLSHPNLCPVYEFDVRDGIAYLTMGYIEGPTLSGWVAKRGGLSQRDAALVVSKLALAMHVAHEGGVVHRDLKPTNVIINKKNEPVILDFGLARQLDDEGTRLTQQGAIYGTPSYMAPEQAGGDPSLIGPACDVYSLGAILYELLTGELPFQGSMMALLGQLLHTPPLPVRARKPSVDAALEAICMKALAKQPADRPRSMKDFARELVKVARVPAASGTKSVPPQQPIDLAAYGSTLPAPGAKSLTPTLPAAGAPSATTPDVSRRQTLTPSLPPTLPTSPPPQHGTRNTDDIPYVLPLSNPKKKRPRRRRSNNWIAWVAALAVVLVGGGIGLYFLLRKDAADVITEPAAAAERVKRQNDLKQIALAYHVYHDANAKGPSKAADLGPALENNKRLLGLLDNKDIVFQFGVGIRDMTDGTSNTVLAYEKDVPTKGGYVALGDGSVRKMTADEFKKAILAKQMND